MSSRWQCIAVAVVLAGSAHAQDSTGVVVPVFDREWGTAGTGPGQFSTPIGVAVGPDGSVYIADRGNSRVQKFTGDGQFLLEWGTAGTGVGQFHSCTGVAVDAQGYVYVTDRLNSRVQKFTSEGQFVLAWGEPGFGPGQFGWYPPPSAATGPWGIAVAPDGTILVVDPGAYRVQRFTPEGVFLQEWGGVFSGTVQAIATDAAGNVFTTDPGAQNRITKFTPGGVVVTTWGGYPCCEGLFRSPLDLDVDSQGNVWIMDAGNALVQVFDNDGGFLVQWGVSGTGPGEFLGPEAVSFGPGGSFYVVDTAANKTERFVALTALQPSTWGAIKALYR
jgi:DNA-binding beta-propeller fold protein YncE